MPHDRMAATIEGLLAQQPQMTTEQDYVRLLHDAGFQRVASVFRIFGGGLSAWIGR